jgi:alkylation response protein AidB-like acyl-CoA dehydrogenase
MELSLSREDAAFRDEVRSFVAANYPQEMRVANPETDLTKEQMLLWHRILHRQGWIAPLWPKEYGGPGWSITQRFVFEQETSRAGTLPPLAFSVTMVGPVVYTFGSDAQKKKFLPRILSGEDWWCQGYSEPGSGSDLASVRTKAVRDGDHYIVNGHKTWTTLAQHADWIFCLVRTDPAAKAQAGISFLLIDMKSPGVTVRPIITIDGSHEVNDVFLEDVRVPIENLIGEENKGLRQVPARQRAHQYGQHRPFNALSEPPQADREDRDRRGRSELRRIHQGHRTRRARCARARGDGTSRRRPDGARHRSGTGGLAVQDPGHRDIPAHHRADPPGDRQ